MPGPLGLYLALLAFAFVGGFDHLVDALEWVWRRRRARSGGSPYPLRHQRESSSPATPYLPLERELDSYVAQIERPR